MGRSQRHQLVEQSTTSAGEVHAQGAVAPGIAMQVDPSTPNVLVPKEQLPESVEVPIGEPGGPLGGSSLTGAIPEGAIWPGTPAPVLTSLSPDTAEIQSGDVVVSITGSGFLQGSILVWNGADDTATYSGPTEMKTTVKTDLSTIASTCTVAVRNGLEVSNELTFELTEPVVEEAPPAGRSYPIGPIPLTSVKDHAEGLELETEGGDVQVGDTVLIEATGNTSVNGEYTVLSVNPLVVDNNLILETPIENKGRLTVTAGA